MRTTRAGRAFARRVLQRQLDCLSGIARKIDTQFLPAIFRIDDLFQNRFPVHEDTQGEGFQPVCPTGVSSVDSTWPRNVARTPGRMPVARTGGTPVLLLWTSRPSLPFHPCDKLFRRG